MALPGENNHVGRWTWQVMIKQLPKQSCWL